MTPHRRRFPSGETEKRQLHGLAQLLGGAKGAPADAPGGYTRISLDFLEARAYITSVWEIEFTNQAQEWIESLDDDDYDAVAGVAICLSNTARHLAVRLSIGSTAHAITT